MATARDQEGSGFANYLAKCWQAWETVLRRIAPENHAEMEERLVDEMGEEFQTRLNQRLTKEGPTGYADAERAVGSQMIAREIKTELMQWVFGTHGIEL